MQDLTHKSCSPGLTLEYYFLLNAFFGDSSGYIGSDIAKKKNYNNKIIHYPRYLFQYLFMSVINSQAFKFN